MTIREVSEKYHISQDTLRYYERIGLIPAVHRTAGGVRDYQETDLGWVEHAICMRSAGVSVEALIEYVRLYQQGDATIEARLHLLQEQEQLLLHSPMRQCEPSLPPRACGMRPFRPAFSAYRLEIRCRKA